MVGWHHQLKEHKSEQISGDLFLYTTAGWWEYESEAQKKSLTPNPCPDDADLMFLKCGYNFFHLRLSGCLFKISF